MLTKRCEPETSLPKNQESNVPTSKLASNKENLLSPARCSFYSDGLEFTELHNTIPKGSTVNKLSLLFPDANTFYTKLFPFGIEIGQRLIETPSLQEDLAVLHVKIGDIEAKGISSNIRKVSHRSKGENHSCSQSADQAVRRC